MSLSDGDFVKVEYSMWRASDNTLVRTTEKKLAEENGIYKDGDKYVPQLIVIGKDRTIKAIWEGLRGMSVGEKKRIELQPKDAFGERDSGLVRIMPISEFRKKDIDPMPGMQIDIDGAIATVKSVNSGRVMVDANHPLAGEKVTYELKVLEKVEKSEDKIKALAEFYDLAPDGVQLNAAMAKIIFGEKAKKDAQYFLNKQEMLAALLSYMDEVKKVEIEELYSKGEKEEEPKKA